MGEYWGYSWTFDFLPSAVLCNGGSRLGDIFLVYLGFGLSARMESGTWHHPVAKLGPLGTYPSFLANISPAHPLSTPLAPWILPTSWPSDLLFPLPEPPSLSPPAPLHVAWLTCPHPGSNVHPFWGCPPWLPPPPTRLLISTVGWSPSIITLTSICN